MAYAAFNNAKPAITDTRQAIVDTTRTNLTALRDTIIATGMVQGFDYSASGGTAEQPAILYFKRSAEWIKVNLTWGTSGGESGNVTKAAFYYSLNSGGAYDNMADAAGKYVITMTYDSNGNCTATTWGSTP